jgi:hypothetical protein
MSFVKWIFLSLGFCWSVAAVAKPSVWQEASMAGVQYYNLSPIFDYKVLVELNQDAAVLWKQLLKENGSADRAMAKIYQGAPDPRLLELHENLLQLIISSQFDNKVVAAYYAQKPSLEFAHITGQPLHPLLRDVASNLRSYLQIKIGVLLNSSKIRGWFFKDPSFHVTNGFYDCTFNNCALMPEFVGKFTTDDLTLSRIDVYADIISNFDLAMADCDRYLSAESAVQDLNFISSHDGPPGTNSRSRRTAMEMATIAPSCLKINTAKASGTPKSRALLYLSQTKLIK